MNVYGGIELMINRYADDIEITAGTTHTRAKAFIQPLLYKNKMYLSGVQLPTGFFDGGHYLMICPAATLPQDNSDTVITDGSKSYKVKRCETVRSQNTDLYIWAVLTIYGAQREDDYDTAQ